MTKEEAIQITQQFLKSCYDCWGGASHYISDKDCEAIEKLIEMAKEKE